MNRLASVLGPAIVAIVALTGCSSGHKAAAPDTTTSVTTTIPASTTSLGPTSTTTPTTVPGSVETGDTGTTLDPNGPRITNFTVSPPSPVSCVANAPTSIQLSWTATGTNSVALSIDGKLFAGFTGGAQTHLEYLACDGKTHTYLLSAHGSGVTATETKLVTSNPSH